MLPGVPVIAEESVGRAAPTSLEPSFVLVDPLDGTKEFLAGRDEFTVNVAIVTRGMPIAGMIAAPAQGRSGAASSAARPNACICRSAPATAKPMTAASSSAAGAWRGSPSPPRAPSRPSRPMPSSPGSPVAKRYLCGSSIKFCRIAAGRRRSLSAPGATREWDIAAGRAILVAAGGMVTDAEGAAPAVWPRGREIPRARFHRLGRSGHGGVGRAIRPDDRRGQRPAIVRATAGHLRAAGSMMPPHRPERRGASRRYRTDKAARRPWPRTADGRHRDAARDRHRIVSAEARRIDLRVVGEGRPVALVAEAPDRTVEAAIPGRAGRIWRFCP